MSDAYTGRFAPTPSGPLHLGSLCTALASHVDARHHGGRWLLRIDDRDPPRVVAGAAEAIQRSLEAHALPWDGPVHWQSAHRDAHDAAIARLQASGRLFPCACSRRDLAPWRGIHPPACVRPPGPGEATALRLRVADGEDRWLDLHQGEIRLQPTRDLGALVVRGRDGLPSYHLACVVDDLASAVTHIVRGADLIPSTSAQRQVLGALGAPAPRWLHLPVLLRRDGHKVSKSADAPAAPAGAEAATLALCLDLLGQAPPPALAHCSPAEVVAWAIRHWRRERLPTGVALHTWTAL